MLTMLEVILWRFKKNGRKKKKTHFSSRQLLIQMTGQASGKIFLQLLNAIFKHFVEKSWANGAALKKDYRWLGILTIFEKRDLEMLTVFGVAAVTQYTVELTAG